MTTKVKITEVGFIVALRDRENFVSVVRPFSGVCYKSGAPLITVRLAWDDEILGEHDKQRKSIGGWTHQVTRHSDGTFCLDYRGEPNASCMSQSQCPKCHQYGTLYTVQQGYGDLTKCRHNEQYSSRCDYESWYDRGD